MAIDDRTLHRDYPKPNADNLLQDDAPRLRDALDAIDADVYAKLDTAAYTPENTLAQIASVDGDGSGLDADLLDGIHASGFSLSSHTHTAATTSAAGFLSASDKAKLDGVESGAQANVVTSVNAATGTVILTATDVGAATSTHIHAAATTSTAGFLSASDKTKLDGIGALANVQSVNSKSGVVTIAAADVGAATSTHIHAAATTSAAGFLSASDKAKIDGIAAGAQVNTVTSVNSKTGTVVLTATDVGAIDASGISSPVDGQALVYNAATSKWVNGSGTGNAKAFFLSSF